jgi:hypothetical protein
MSIRSRAIIIIALLLASTPARTDGIWNPTVGGWGSEGLNTMNNIGSCTNSLNFSQACNSQYLL